MYLVLAQAVPPSTLERTLEVFLSPSGITAVVTLVATALGLVFGSSEVRRRRLALAAHHAFMIVEELSAETENTNIDKAAEGLRALDAFLLAQKWRPAKPYEQEIAKLRFKELNGASLLETKVRADAAMDSGTITGTFEPAISAPTFTVRRPTTSAPLPDPTPPLGGQP